MQNLIPVVNKLQDVFNAIGNSPIDLPQIVVIGAQSSGKSSVLENVVGEDFLPRGTGIVTRRPLILQLFNTSGEAGGKDKEAYGEFLHRPDDKIYDFEEIREEIQRETDRTTGRNKGISTKPISLRIHSPTVLNLTLVDLPGITKVSVGDQPADIEFQIHDMCMQYIQNPNAVILAVTAGNTDLANSDALKMAREVDPEGTRTVGVITKLDLMDPGTDASEMLQNRIIPLRLGYVGVVNRGQRDIDNRKKISEAQKKEAEFFRNHSMYRHMLTRCGTQNMTRMLNQILMHHIRDTLPDIKQRIASLLMEVQAELDALGEPTSDQTQRSLGSALLQLISRFCDSFGAAIDGRGGSSAGKPGLSSQMTELYGGARVSYIFNDIFGRSLQSFDPFDGLPDDQIRTVIANAHGTRQSLFVPEISFDLLVKRQIARLEQPGLTLILNPNTNPNSLSLTLTLTLTLTPKAAVLRPRIRGDAAHRHAVRVHGDLALPGAARPRHGGGLQAPAALHGADAADDLQHDSDRAQLHQHGAPRLHRRLQGRRAAHGGAPAAGLRRPPGAHHAAHAQRLSAQPQRPPQPLPVEGRLEPRPGAVAALEPRGGAAAAEQRRRRRRRHHGSHLRGQVGRRERAAGERAAEPGHQAAADAGQHEPYPGRADGPRAHRDGDHQVSTQVVLRHRAQELHGHGAEDHNVLFGVQVQDGAPERACRLALQGGRAAAAAARDGRRGAAASHLLRVPGPAREGVAHRQRGARLQRE
uniref:Dynamin-type G domain-containing protein n=1 Tax=Phaeomonas parva TaxID=124430 RepID=A0A6U4DCU1_9STRA|mmetsp:Transcript_16808/g.51673  ORF Transcript_16808/g.51673 Transcript_16808/m.51673 type:complete len:754 (+) Transcript_16808:1333-3594(+)